ncbi:MAG: YbhB/YbcL family Raf kinase inhibitor-like protein [Pseudomonadota bacterium]
MPFILTSPAFIQGATIPIQYSCDGADLSPPLQWSGAPRGTKSFFLACHDPDAPMGVFQHWAAFDIPAAWTRLPEGFSTSRAAAGIRQAINDFQRPGYGGPCPPKGDQAHHYHFTLHALDIAALNVAPDAPCLAVDRGAEPHILASTVLVGVYRR